MILYNFTPCGDTFWFVIAFTWFLWQVDTVISSNRMNKVLYILIFFSFFSFSANNLVHAIENTFTKFLPLPHPPPPPTPKNHHHHHQASQIFSKPSREVTQAFKLGRSHISGYCYLKDGGDGLCRETERERLTERHTQRQTHRDRERRTQRETERERDTHTHTHTHTEKQTERERQSHYRVLQLQHLKTFSHLWTHKTFFSHLWTHTTFLFSCCCSDAVTETIAMYLKVWLIN